MPVMTTYPGVYIEEIPSGSTTIVGVATSITAFLGRAPRGPANEPVTIFSFADYDRTFGGLDRDSPMSYAVRDFYNNGGRQAVIVRLFAPDDRDFENRLLGVREAVDSLVRVVKTATSPELARTVLTTANEAVKRSQAPDEVKAAAEEVFKKTSDATITVLGEIQKKAEEIANAQVKKVEDERPKTRALIKLAIDDKPVTDATKVYLVLEAKQPGPCMSRLRARIDHVGHDPSDPDDAPQDASAEAVEARTAVGKRFNLSLQDGKTGDVEVFSRVSTDAEDPRYVASVLRDESLLAKVRADVVPGARPKAHAPAPIGRLPFGEQPFDESQPTWFTEQGVTPLEDGSSLSEQDYLGNARRRTGLYSLKNVDLFNILYIPPDKFGQDLPTAVHTAAARFCVERRAFYLVDGLVSWDASQNQFVAFYSGPNGAPKALSKLGIGDSARNAAVFLPRVRKPDPLRQGRLELFPPGGMMAGVMARTDAARGVWKAPAGLEAGLNGAVGLAVEMTDDENGVLNPLGLNCLRSFPVTGNVVWGTRTGRGADRIGDLDNRYIPVRRLTLFIEESLYRGTQFAVFEPNGKTLWGSLRLAIGSFMQGLFVQGAFYSYKVTCDEKTTTPDDIKAGQVNALVEFAPVMPAEFVILRIQQQALPTQP